MKKFKKLLAGLLSLAMVASMLPMTMVSAALTTPAREGYQFFETFDDDTVPTAFAMTANTHWSQSIDDGAMKFTWNADSVTEGASTSVLSVKVGGADRSSDAFEYGFKVKMNNVKSNISRLMNQRRTDSATTWRDCPIIVNSTVDGKIGANAYYWNSTGSAAKTASVDYTNNEYINIKVYVDWFTAKTTVSYSTDDGATWTDMLDYTATTKVNDGTSRTKFYVNGTNQKLNTLELIIDDTDAVTEKATNADHIEEIWIDDVYVKNIDIPKYKITYNTNGGSTVSEKLLPLADTQVTLAAAPTMDGGKFTGWYSDENCENLVGAESTTVNLADLPFVENENGGKDVTLYAGWQTGYQVSFSGTTTEVADLTVPTGSNILASELPFLANEDGKTFIGWCTDEACETLYNGEEITDDTVLYAKWDENYLLWWDFEGYQNNPIFDKTTDRWTVAPEDGKMVFSYDLSLGEAAGIIGGTNNYGASHGQNVSITQGTDYEVSYEVDFTNATHIKGKFVPVFSAPSQRAEWSSGRYFEMKAGTVVYQPGSANGVVGSTSSPSITLANVDGAIKVTEKYDTYPEMKSVAWSGGSTTVGLASVTATLEWTENEIAKTAEVSWYVIAAGSNKYAPTGFNYTKVQDTTTTTEGTGYITLDNVYVKELDNFVIPMQTVSYESNGGTEVTTASYSAAVTTLTLPTVTKDGGDFTGWYSDSDLANRIGNAGEVVNMADLPFETDEYGDKTITLYAGWQSGNAVSFSGTTATIADITVPDGEGIAAEDLPYPANEDGKTFAGWYLDEELQTPYNGEVIEAATTLYAAWDENYIYNWSFDYYAIPDRLKITSGNPRWSQALSDGKLVYTLDATKGEEGESYTVWSGTKLGITVEEGKNYETNYTVDLRNNSAAMTFTPFVLGTTNYTNQQYGIFSLVDSGSSVKFTVAQRVSALQGDNIGYNAAGANLGFNAIDKSTIASPINVKTYYMTYAENKDVLVDGTTFNASGEAKAVITYTNADNEEVILNIYWYIGGTIGGYTKPNVFEYTKATESSAVVSDTLTSSFTLDNVYLREVPSFTVNFVNGDETSQVVTDKGVVTVTLPDEPQADDGQVFLGWYADSACTQLVAAAGATTVDNVSLYDDDNDTVVTLYAGWQTGYRVDFVNGEENVTTILVGSDGAVDASDIPFLANSEDGTFVGWFDEADEPFMAENAVTASKTYYAKFDTNYSLWWDFNQTAHNSVLDVDDERWTSAVVDGKMQFSYDLSQDTDGNIIGHDGYGASNGQGATYVQGEKYEVSYEVDFTNSKNITAVFAPIYLSNSGRTDWSMGRHFQLKGDGTVVYQAGVNGVVASSSTPSINLSNVDGAIKVTEIYDTFDEAKEITYGDGSTDTSGLAEARAVLVWTSNGEQKTAEVTWYVIAAGSADLVPTDFNAIKLSDTTVTGEGTGYITLDNVYVGTPMSVTLSFDANGGDEIEETVTKLGAFVASDLPTPTADNGLYFGGWYRSYENGVYTGKVSDSVYVAEDTTLIARWVDAPTAEIVALPNNGVNAARDTSITIKFDSEMDETTLTASNIQLWKNGIKLAASSYTLSISKDPETANTIVTLKPNRDLDYASNYAVVVTTGVANYGGAMENEVSTSFTTSTLKLNIQNATLNVGTTNIGDEVSKASNQTATITFNLAEVD